MLKVNQLSFSKEFYIFDENRNQLKLLYMGLTLIVKAPTKCKHFQFCITWVH